MQKQQTLQNALMQKIGNSLIAKLDTSLLKQKTISQPLKSQRISLDYNDSYTMSTSSIGTYNQPAEALDWDVPKLGEAHINEIEKCNKYRPDDVEKHYDHLATNYDGIYKRVGYPDPQKVADTVKQLTKSQKSADVKILDIGCGTGLVGECLVEHGFKQVKGLDISMGMLDKAAEKCVYTALEEHDLGEPDTFPQKLKNQFDIVTCTGLINNNYMNYTLFEQMLMALNKGGIAVFAARYSFLGEFWYEKILKEMEKEGRWEQIHVEAFHKYDNLPEGIGRFTKTPVKVYAFVKLQENLNIYKKRDVEDTMGFFTGGKVLDEKDE